MRAAQQQQQQRPASSAAAARQRRQRPTAAVATRARCAYEGESGAGGGAGASGAGDVGASSSPFPPRPLPQVDWNRHHLLILIVDHADSGGGARGKLCAALFEKVAEWNGHGRTLAATAAVLLPPPPPAISPSPASAASPLPHAPQPGEWEAHPRLRQAPPLPMDTAAALMRQASLLGLAPRALARAAEVLDVPSGDLDRFDLVVAVDERARDAVLRAVEADFGGGDSSNGSGESPLLSSSSSSSSPSALAWPPRTAAAALSYYGARVRTLSDYGAVLTDDAALARGGLALLPRAMQRNLLRPAHGSGGGEDGGEAEAAAKRRRARPRMRWRFGPPGAGSSGVGISGTPIAGGGGSSSGASSATASGDDQDDDDDADDAARRRVTAAARLAAGLDAAAAAALPSPPPADGDDDGPAALLCGELRAAGGLPDFPADLSTPAGAAQWRACVRLATWQSAALARHLIDLAPPEGWETG